MKILRGFFKPMRAVRFRWRNLAYLLIILAVIKIAQIFFMPPLAVNALAATWKLAVLVYCAYYGLYRGLRFHPAGQRSYWNWLRQTPWQVGRPLPLGQVTLVWQDVIVAAFATLLFASPFGWLSNEWMQSRILIPLLVILLGYLIPHSLLLMGYGTKWGKILVLTAWPAVILMPYLGMAILAILSIYAVILHQIKRSLAAISKIEKPFKYQANEDLGWQYKELSNKSIPKPHSLMFCWVFSIIAGWWIFAILDLILPSSQPEDSLASRVLEAILFVALGVFLPIGLRLNIYTSRYKSPHALLSRIMTGRLIIPAYDVVYLAPLAALLVGSIFFTMILRGDGYFSLNASLGFTSVLGTVLSLGPTLQRWKLTGENSLAAALTPSTSETPRTASRRQKTDGVPHSNIPIFFRSTYFTRWLFNFFAPYFLLIALIFPVLQSLIKDRDLFLVLGSIIWLIVAIHYPSRRISRFHPIFQKNYILWLGNSPWNPGKPLPIGPAFLVWQDIAIPIGLAALWLIYVFIVMHRLRLVLIEPVGIYLGIFAFGYLWACLQVFRRTDQVYFLLLQWFLMGWIVLLFPSFYVLIPVFIGAVIGSVGLRRSLRGFPWPKRLNPQHVTNQKISLFFEPYNVTKLGICYSRLGPKISFQMMRKRIRILLILLIGWWLWVVMNKMVGWQMIQIAQFVLFGVIVPSTICVMGLIIRISLYMEKTAPPLSLLGRIFTGRLIIPGYDRVLIAPIAAILTTIACAVATNQFHFPYIIAAPVTTMAVLLILTLSGPSLKRWRLTGSYRLKID